MSDRDKQGPDSLITAVKSIAARLENRLGRMQFRLLLCVLVLFIALFISELIPEPQYIKKEALSDTDVSQASSEADESSSVSADESSVNSETAADSTSDSSTPVNSDTSDGAAASVSDVSSQPESEADHENALKPLKIQVEQKLSEFPGTWSVYCKNLNTNDWFTINEHPVYPASMIKMFAMAACYQKIEDGEIDENEYYPTIFSMAAISNNQAFNDMVWVIGKTYITEWCHSHGLPNTAQYHGLQPSTNYEGLETSDERNVTCASDAGHLLEQIYRGECVSKYASERMLSILEQQKWTGKIPSGLPWGTRYANKTGDTFDATHDAAIVFSDGADYILVLTCEEPDICFQLKYCFVQTSKLVYEFFNGPFEFGF